MDDLLENITLLDSDCLERPRRKCAFWCNCTRPSSSGALCGVCSSMDLDRLIHVIRPTGDFRPVHDLSHIADSDCPMCIFLRNCFPPPLEGQKRNFSEFTLMAGRARFLFEYPIKGIQESSAFRINHGSKLYAPCRIMLPTSVFPTSANFCISARHSIPNMIEDSLIKEWLDFCDHNHKKCKSNVGTQIPGMHVMDCITKRVIPLIQGTKPYIALSYIWGPPTRATGIGKDFAEKLPDLIEDAMSMVRRLGFQYLWIDRYCIPQHDEAMKRLQIQSMDKIYANSSFTIIVAAGANPECGIPGVSSMPRSENPTIRLGHHCLIGTYKADRELAQAKWSTRGW